MKRFLNSIAKVAIFSAFATGSVLLSAEMASAQVRGMDGSYLGGGASVGVTDNDDGSNFGGNIQGRLDTPRLPVSLRGSALFNGDNTALMPIVSYDIGVAPNTNLYVGGGYSFVLGGDDESSLLGDQDAPVLTAGIETAVHPNIVLYGDAKLGIDAQEDSGSAASLQVGAAYRF